MANDKAPKKLSKFPNNIYMRRKLLGLTQDSISEATAIPQKMLAYLETGWDWNIGKSNIIRLADILCWDDTPDTLTNKFDFESDLKQFYVNPSV